MMNLEFPQQTKRVRSFDKKRQRIIKAAADLFVKKGYLNTTIREIAEASGMSVGTLYHYVNSKNDVLALFMDWQIVFIKTYINDNEAMLSRKNPTQALKIGIKTYITAVYELQDIILFWYQDTRNLPPDIIEHLLKIEYDLTDMFAKVISLGCASGEFKVRDATLAAHSIIVLADMWAFRRWALRKHYTLDHFIREQTKFILAGLRNGSY